MLTFESIPPYWHLALDRVQRYNKSAVISGGAIRDLDLGRPVKDIDIFVSAEAAMKSIKGVIGDMSTAWTENPEYADGTARAILASSTSNPVDKSQLPINITKLGKGSNPRERWREHDFGLCQIMFDGHKFESTEYYEHDKENQTLTLTHCDSYYAWYRSFKRYHRLFQKYPWPMETKLVRTN